MIEQRSKYSLAKAVVKPKISVVDQFDVKAALCRHRARSTRRHLRQIGSPPEFQVYHLVSNVILNGEGSGPGSSGGILAPKPPIGSKHGLSPLPVASLVIFLTLLVPASLAAPSQAATTAQEHADKGLQLAQSGDLGSAESELRKAIALSPNDPGYLADLGGILGMQQKLEEANPYFEKALKIDPANTTIRRDLAANQWQLGRLGEAKENLDRILKTTRGDKPTILLLGMVAENLKDYATAARLLESVPALVNERAESIVALARSYYHAGRKQKARETLESRLSPAGSQAVFLGGEAASEAGDYETAMDLLASIRTTYPDQAADNTQVTIEITNR